MTSAAAPAAATAAPEAPAAAAPAMTTETTPAADVPPAPKKRLALQPPPRPRAPAPVAPVAAPVVADVVAAPAAADIATPAVAPAAAPAAPEVPAAAAPAAVVPEATTETAAPAEDAPPAPRKRLALQPLPRRKVPVPVAADSVAPAAPAAPASETAAAASRPVSAPIAEIQAASATANAALAELESRSLLESEAGVGGSLCQGAACKAYCTGGVANVAAMNKRAKELGIAAVDPASLRNIEDAIYTEFVKRGCTPKNRKNLETGFANCGLLLKAGLTLLPEAIAQLAVAALKVRDYKGPAPVPLACLPNTEAARAAERKAQAGRATAPAKPQQYAIFVVSAARTLQKQMDLLCAHFPKGQ